MMMLLMFTVAFSANAQTVVEKYDSQKFFDNTYVVVNGGVATPTVGYSFWKDMNANAGIRLGKDITPVFGVAVGSNAYFSEFGKQSGESDLVVKYLNTTVLAKVDVLNCFKVKDRKFSLSVLAGPGWGRSFVTKTNDVTANFMVNADYKVGKRVSIYVEPSLVYGLHKGDRNLEFNINRSFVQLNAGVVYHFGKVGFPKTKYVTFTDYEALTSTINSLRADLAKKPTEVVKEVTTTVTKVIYVTPGVGFDKGSAVLDYKSVANIDAIAKLGKKVTVTGYASKDNYLKNTELSKTRAEVVADALVAAGLSRDLITVDYKGDSVQPYSVNEVNRIATITVTE